jgi:hypothetical protein
MATLYAVRSDMGLAAFCMGNGIIVGVDEKNGRYNGTYTEKAGRIRLNVTMSPSGAAEVPLTADWPSSFASGAPQQVMIDGKPVSVTFEKVGDVP